jgi:hypothetical protein
MRSRIDGICRISLKCLLSSRTNVSGSPAGPIMPGADLGALVASSVSVGTSGRSGERFGSATASTRSLPSRRKPSTGPSVVNIIGTWPPTSAGTAGALPWKGTCVSCTGGLGEQLGQDVHGRAVARAGVRLDATGLGRGDELVHAAHARLRIDHDEQGLAAELDDGREVGHRVVHGAAGVLQHQRVMATVLGASSSV